MRSIGVEGFNGWLMVGGETYFPSRRVITSEDGGKVNVRFSRGRHFLVGGGCDYHPRLLPILPMVHDLSISAASRANVAHHCFN